MTEALSLREYLTLRLDHQDGKLEEMDARLTTIDASTNGRLRDLETERRVLLAINERRWKWGYGAVMLLSGGVGGGIGHALGWW